MGPFENANRIEREIRRCKTRAFGARLFAGYSQSPSTAEVWSDIARSWDDLAFLKIQIAKTRICLDRAAQIASQSPHSDRR